METLETLYVGVLKESHRILKPNGRAAFLTSEFELFGTALDSDRDWRLCEQIRDIRVLGRRADIFVVEPR